MGDNSDMPKDFRVISFEEALEFKKLFPFPSLTSISVLGTFGATLKFQSIKTNLISRKNPDIKDDHTFINN